MAYMQLKFYTSIDTDCIWKFFRLCKCTGECEWYISRNTLEGVAYAKMIFRTLREMSLHKSNYFTFRVSRIDFFKIKSFIGQCNLLVKTVHS